MFFSSTHVVMFGLSSTLAIQADGFLSAPALTGIPRSRSHHTFLTLTENETQLAKDLRAIRSGTRLHLNCQRHFFQNKPQIFQSEEQNRRRLSLSLSSQSFNSDSPIHSSPFRRTTVVYLLILASLLSFLGDNIMHLPVFRKFYLYHRNWSWWQPITSTFCHGDKSHLSGNIFLLLLFGRSVEDEVGSVGLLFSYIFCGVVANLVSLAVLPKSTVSLGASGAVFGLFSVSILSRLSWRDILDWRKIIEVGVLGEFVFERFLNEAKTAATGGIAGVNHVAHLAGAGAGVAMILILRVLIKIMEKN